MRWLVICIVFIVACAAASESVKTKQSIHDYVFIGTCDCGDFCNCCNVASGKRPKVVCDCLETGVCLCDVCLCK